MTGGSGNTLAPPVNPIVTASGSVAASADDAAQLQTIIDAADSGEHAPIAVPVTTRAQAARLAVANSALAGLGETAEPRYSLDTRLLAVVLAAGGLLLGAATAVRARRDVRAD